MPKQPPLLADELDDLQPYQRLCAVCGRGYQSRSLDVVYVKAKSWPLCGRCGPRMLTVLRLLADEGILDINDVWHERGHERDRKAQNRLRYY